MSDTVFYSPRGFQRIWKVYMSGWTQEFLPLESPANYKIRNLFYLPLICFCVKLSAVPKPGCSKVGALLRVGIRQIELRIARVKAAAV